MLHDGIDQAGVGGVQLAQHGPVGKGVEVDLAQIAAAAEGHVGGRPTSKARAIDAAPALGPGAPTTITAPGMA